MYDERSAQDIKKLKASLSPLPEPEVIPSLIVISGLPGAGKSYFARRLVEKAPAVIVESDAMRKALFPTSWYTPEESQRVFQATHLLIEDLLQRGISVIFDATNLTERHREPLYNIADRSGARLIIVRVEAPPEVVRERLRRRAERPDAGDKSDADWQVYRKMLGDRENIRRNHFVVDTSRDITPVIEKIAREMQKGKG
ncbi:MAG: ATP-binding protein [Dehalococcoidia bacterium]|nr:ATP-binding protein [Dehalococcoidia bacterium]